MWKASEGFSATYNIWLYVVYTQWYQQELTFLYPYERNVITNVEDKSFLQTKQACKHNGQILFLSVKAAVKIDFILSKMCLETVWLLHWGIFWH